MFDQMDNGTISLNELSFVLRSFGANPKEADICKMKEICKEDRGQFVKLKVTLKCSENLIIIPLLEQAKSCQISNLEKGVRGYMKIQTGWAKSGLISKVTRLFGWSHSKVPLYNVNFNIRTYNIWSDPTRLSTHEQSVCLNSCLKSRMPYNALSNSIQMTKIL